MTALTFALAEEIGDPAFFMGRDQELKFYLDWVEGSKKLHSKSQALLSRRKKGKTALVQRLFNLIYSQNDPLVVPFFFRVQEEPLGKPAFGGIFYRAFLSQYLGFRLREPKLINKTLDLDKLKELAARDQVLLDDIQGMERIAATDPDQVWSYAQAAPHRLATDQGIRIIQIIDEFQYLNRFVFNDASLQTQIDLCHSYMGLAESKYAPLLVTGSYIGWLSTILTHMTARFEDRKLESLTDEDALAAVYNYAALTGHEVTDATAAYIAEVAYNDPFYISQIIRTQKPDPDLTTEEGVREALQFETTYGKGYVAKIWMEYIAEGISRINDKNGKKIVLFLAKHGDQEFTRHQIAEELKLDITDDQLADRLFKLKHADLIAGGSSPFRFKGLGDPIFAAVFRKHYEEEIEQTPQPQVMAQIEAELKTARKQSAWYKGLAGEYRVMFHLLSAIQQGKSAEDFLFNPVPEFNPDGFSRMKKHSFHLDQNQRIEVDIFAENAKPENADLVVEVKTWDKPVSNEAVNQFIELKKNLTAHLQRPAVFLLYSEMGFTQGQEAEMRDHGIMYTTRDKLIGS